MKLLDVNVWVAAAWAGHAHHRRTAAWFQASTERLLMCRVAQMGVLRLLANPAVLGIDVVSRKGAWAAFDSLRADRHVVFRDEPAGLEPVWRALSTADDRGHKLWTDDYLAAFAQAARVTLVTLDRGFVKRYPAIKVEVI